jgi:hypothetical protein
MQPSVEMSNRSAMKVINLNSTTGLNMINSTMGMENNNQSTIEMNMVEYFSSFCSILGHSSRPNQKLYLPKNNDIRLHPIEGAHVIQPEQLMSTDSFNKKEEVIEFSDRPLFS